jgi:hypothetical protein
MSIELRQITEKIQEIKNAFDPKDGTKISKREHDRLCGMLDEIIPFAEKYEGSRCAKVDEQEEVLSRCRRDRLSKKMGFHFTFNEGDELTVMGSGRLGLGCLAVCPRASNVVVIVGGENQP